MNEELKKKILVTKEPEDFGNVMEEYFQSVVESLYKDKDILSHLCKIFDADEELLKRIFSEDFFCFDDFDDSDEFEYLYEDIEFEDEDI